MQNRWIRIFVWLGIMAILTLIAIILWVIGDGNYQSTPSLKWLQLAQTTAMFVLPSLFCAWMWDEHQRPFTWLKMDRLPKGQDALFVIAIMLCALPAINLLADLNGRIVLPDSLSGLEQWLKQTELEAAELTKRFLHAESIGGMLLNLGLMALLPGFAEELSFRGTLQQLLSAQDSQSKTQDSPITPHIAIWLTGFIFSAIHMQFYGFIPRMLMGVMFGYVFLWSGNLWLAMLMHFTNNGIAVIAYHIAERTGESEEILTNYADTIGAGTTWWIGVLSLVITCLGLLIFYRRTHTR